MAASIIAAGNVAMSSVYRAIRKQKNAQSAGALGLGYGRTVFDQMI